ncbi:hypothetical protein [Bradyrhizobium sp. CCBAU 65884]|nr:hypothetical protein [Bradyrhizobium sp. CCBAU 65884]
MITIAIVAWPSVPTFSASFPTLSATASEENVAGPNKLVPRAAFDFSA